MRAARTVLVTGASGFIGRATVAALIDLKWEITVAARLADRAVPRGAIHVDLADPATILQLANGPRFDAIIHLGARIGWTGESEAELFAPNVLATACLAHLARLWNSHLVFASAAVVHGLRQERIASSSAVCPDTPYAMSKWLAEQLLASSHARHCVLRIGGVFGFGGPSHLGLNRALDAAIGGEAPVLAGPGNALRNYVYVKDVARAVVSVLDEQLEGTHLLAGHEVLSFRAMLRAICDTFLKGSAPVSCDGPDALSQVIDPSPSLPETRTFREALLDIRRDAGQ